MYPLFFSKGALGSGCNLPRSEHPLENLPLHLRGRLSECYWVTHLKDRFHVIGWSAAVDQRADGPVCCSEHWNICSTRGRHVRDVRPHSHLPQARKLTGAIDGDTLLSTSRIFTTSTGEITDTTSHHTSTSPTSRTLPRMGRTPSLLPPVSRQLFDLR